MLLVRYWSAVFSTLLIGRASHSVPYLLPPSTLSAPLLASSPIALLCARKNKHIVKVNCLKITPDKQYLAAAGNPHVRLFEINSLNTSALVSYDGHTTNVTDVGERHSTQRDGRRDGRRRVGNWIPMIVRHVRQGVHRLDVVVCSPPYLISEENGDIHRIYLFSFLKNNHVGFSVDPDPSVKEGYIAKERVTSNTEDRLFWVVFRALSCLFLTTPDFTFLPDTCSLLAFVWTFPVRKITLFPDGKTYTNIRFPKRW